MLINAAVLDIKDISCIDLILRSFTSFCANVRQHTADQCSAAHQTICNYCTHSCNNNTTHGRYDHNLSNSNWAVTLWNIYQRRFSIHFFLPSLPKDITLVLFWYTLSHTYNIYIMFHCVISSCSRIRSSGAVRPADREPDGWDDIDNLMNNIWLSIDKMAQTRWSNKELWNLQHG